MELGAFFLADHAEAVNGKVYVTGGAWNMLWLAELPGVHAHFAMVTIIRVPWQATNQRHGLEIDLVDEDGASKLPEPIRSQFEAGRPPGMRPGDETNVVLVFVLEGLSFEREGPLSFTLTVNGTELGRIPIKVALHPMARSA